MMALKIVENLINNLNSNDINYCHWKSNEHIEAAINGDTDLDILFDQFQKDQIENILRKNNFNLFESAWYHRYKGIVDYIGFDQETGKIVHVHSHFKLVIGETGIKSYNLPWESLILENKIFNNTFNIFTSSPEIEYLLLVVRTAFKYDKIDTRSNKTNAQHFNIEAFWLYEQIDLFKLLDISNKHLDDKISDLIKKIRMIEKYEENYFIKLKKMLTLHFTEQRILSKRRVAYLKLIHFFKKVALKTGSVIGIKIVFSKRYIPNKGIIVSLMGSDGAGKSTQVKEITKELSKKVDVSYMYMGSGDGPKSVFRGLIECFLKLGSKLISSNKAQNIKSSNSSNKNNNLSNKTFLKQFVLSLHAVSLAHEKKQRLKYINNKRNKGYIVICDRYPQTMTLGYNDGPKLYDNINSSNFILKYLSKYEFLCYNLANEVYPDIVIKLNGSLDVLHSRRPEMTKEEIEKKQTGIMNLNFAPQTKVILLDIDKSVNKIKGEILKNMSEYISSLNIKENDK